MSNTSGQLRNGLIAIAAVALGVCLFLAIRLQGQQADLDAVAARAVALADARTNSKPTLVEFYADWCTSCRSMAPTMFDLESQYGADVNFVMLNVDNTKWLPELTTYRVNGIPHFEFLSAEGDSLGRAIGEQPPVVMAANLTALQVGDGALATASSTGRTSDFTAPSAAQTQPRSHG